MKVETDHKPLESVFKKPLINNTARLQRLLLNLQTYDLKVIYVPGNALHLADTLSRAYLKSGQLVKSIEEALEGQVLELKRCC